MLAPLNLLLLSDQISRVEVPVPFDIGFKLGAVALLAWMVRGGARDVLTPRPEWRWLVALAVVGAPATQLLPAAWSAGAAPWLALACFVGALVLALRSARRGGDEPLARAAGIALLHFVGFAAFALAAPWVFHAARSPDSPDRVSRLALPPALAAMPICRLGLVQRRARRRVRATGTGVALAGFTYDGAGAAPPPLLVLLVSSAAGLFTRVALMSATWAQAGAIPLQLSPVVGYGTPGWAELLAELLRSADSGVVPAAWP